MKSGLYQIEITTSFDCDGDISEGILIGNKGTVILKLEPVPDELTAKWKACPLCKTKMETQCTEGNIKNDTAYLWERAAIDGPVSREELGII